MIATSTYYNAAPRQVAHAKIKAVFAGSTGPSLQLDYNGAHASFRIQVNNSRRLFFFEQDVFQKVLFKNEYGVVIGQLFFSKPDSGIIKIDGKRYRFALPRANDNLTIFDLPVAGTSFTVAVTDQLLVEAELDAQHKRNVVYCLVFAFAWALSRAQ
jgi:hypothetical protein